MLLFIFGDWVEKNWEAIKWPSFFVIFIFIALTQKQQISAAHGVEDINQIVARHPWIKFYMCAYCLAVAVGCYIVVSKGIHLIDLIGIVEMTLAMLGILFPVFIIQQMQSFKNAGDKI